MCSTPALHFVTPVERPLAEARRLANEIALPPVRGYPQVVRHDPVSLVTEADANATPRKLVSILDR